MQRVPANSDKVAKVSAKRDRETDRMVRSTAKTTHSFISQSPESFFNEVWMDSDGLRGRSKGKTHGGVTGRPVTLTKINQIESFSKHF